MWKGRFSSASSNLLLQFGESVSFDWRLYAHDVAGSIAHARQQLRAGLLTQEEFAQIESGLLGILADIEAGNFEWDVNLEDVHMNIEAELTKRIGSAGAKLHTARSRNDQVATDTRLYCRSEIDAILQLAADLQKALVQQAAANARVILPGYTHLQRAQPVSLAHHLLAYVEMLERDKQRLQDCRKRLNVCPLGSGAIAGSTICLDRLALAAELGFDGVTQNSMDAIADRDYILELLFCLSMVATHLSRLSEDAILWCSSEFGFVTFSDAHTTGSSLMPQKKNPDIAELTRGKTGRVFGSLVSVLTAVKGLALTYNRDLQEDKPALFDAIDTVKMCLSINAEMYANMQVNSQRMAAAAADAMLLATDLADYLVLKGVPFRQAHELVGKAVAYAVAEKRSLAEMSVDEYRAISPHYEADCLQVFDLQRAFEKRDNVGAPGWKQTAQRLEYWQSQLGC